MIELKTTLSTLLRKRGWSLNRLAKESGVPVSTLHSWVAGGKSSYNLQQLKKVSTVLETPVHALMFGCSDPFEGREYTEALKELFSGDVRVTIHRILKTGGARPGQGGTK